MTARILAYLDRISCGPGERLALKVSAPAGKYEARVRRYRGGAIGDMPAPADVVLDCGAFDAGPQPLTPGSYADLPLGGRRPPFTLALWVLPTLPDLEHPQTVLDLGGVAVRLEAGRFVIRGPVKARVDSPVAKAWFGLVLRLDGSTAELLVTNATGRELGRASVPVSTGTADLLRLAASLGAPGDFFNGKLCAPRIWREAGPGEPSSETAAEPDLAWNFSRWRSVDSVTGIGVPDGKTVNLPARGVTGRLWDGTAHKPADNPAHYDAIHFHDDDLADAGWDTSLEIALPADLRSGVYAVEVSGSGRTETVPFFVRGRPARDRVLLLIPTNTYIAYANEGLIEFDLSDMMDHAVEPGPRERYILEHPELGKSVYDLHTDGGGVFYSSRLRPMLNLHPEAPNWLNGGPRHLAADLHIVGFLEQAGIAYDVATDEDLHRRGANLLAGYGAVLAGSHPEYCTRPMMESVRAHIHSGGRLVYLGGNGFYWVCDLVDNAGSGIEIRRGIAGTRSWTSEPGEVHLSTNGHVGGLWRHAGIPPNSITGIGFAAEGWGRASAYRRLPASRSGPAARFFDGIEEDLIGTDGLALGGAAGDEVDRFDETFGAPGKVYRLATSEPMSSKYRLVIEDQMVSAADTRGGHHPDVRADMVYVETESGGRIFSAGSICFAASLPVHGFANPAARLLRNVIRDFLD